MTYVAIALIMSGFVMGMAFQLKALLLALAPLFALSVWIAYVWELDLLDAAVVVLAVQTIVQSSYFAGSMVRTAVATTPFRRRPT